MKGVGHGRLGLAQTQWEDLKQRKGRVQLCPDGSGETAGGLGTLCDWLDVCMWLSPVGPKWAQKLGKL